MWDLFDSKFHENTLKISYIDIKYFYFTWCTSKYFRCKLDVALCLLEKKIQETKMKISLSKPEDATVVAKAWTIILINVLIKLEFNFVVFEFLY